jgi:branched-chain amino acid transport system permease protein
MFAQILLSGIVSGYIYSLFGIGLAVLYRGTTILNFSQGELFMLGAYSAFSFTNLIHLNYPLAILLSIIAVSVIGGFIFKYILKRLLNAPHINQVLVTNGLIFVFQGVVRFFWGSEILFIPPLLGHRPIMFKGIMITPQEIAILVVASIFAVVFTLVFLFTKAGKLMQAASQSLRGAALIGINVNNFHTVMWAVGAGIAALSGILVGPLISVMPEMGGDIMIKAFAAMTLGGFGSIPGALVGGLLMGIIENITAFYISTTLREISAFFIIIVVLVIKPTGIMGVKIR